MPSREQQDMGFFPGESLVRRVHREAVVYAAGPRALLLQFAHPKVAAGLRAHGELAIRPVQRLLYTFRTMEQMLFGATNEATHASNRTAARHAAVQGVLSEDVGRYRAGEPYSALDPELLLWVLATLIDSSLLAYETFVAPLSPEDRERYYREILRASPLLGLTPAQMPPTHQAFRAYFERVVADGTLAIGSDARALAASLLDRKHLGAPLSLAVQTLAADLLPEQLRAAYGLSWSRRRQAGSAVLRSAVRGFVALAPRRIRELRPWDLAGRGASPACPFSRLSAVLGART